MSELESSTISAEVVAKKGRKPLTNEAKLASAEKRRLKKESEAAALVAVVSAPVVAPEPAAVVVASAEKVKKPRKEKVNKIVISDPVVPETVAEPATVVAVVEPAVAPAEKIRKPRVKKDKDAAATGDKPVKEKKEKKAKKEVDPNKPKRAKSPYIVFCTAVREQTKQEFMAANGILPTFGELGKLLGAKWSGLSEDERKTYVAEAARLETESA